MPTAPQGSVRRRYLVTAKCYHDRIVRPGEVIELFEHEAGAHHELLAYDPLTSETVGSPSPVEEIDRAGTSTTTAGEQPARKRRYRRKAPGYGAAYASDIYCAEIVASKIAGEFRFFCGSEQWFKKAGRRWIMASPTELVEICRAVLDDIAQYTETLPAYIRRPEAVAAVLNLTTCDRSIARAGMRPGNRLGGDR